MILRIENHQTGKVLDIPCPKGIAFQQDPNCEWIVEFDIVGKDRVHRVDKRCMEVFEMENGKTFQHHAWGVSKDWPRIPKHK